MSDTNVRVLFAIFCLLALWLLYMLYRGNCDRERCRSCA
jgi:hypothetical protein